MQNIKNLRELDFEVAKTLAEMRENYLSKIRTSKNQ